MQKKYFYLSSFLKLFYLMKQLYLLDNIISFL